MEHLEDGIAGEQEKLIITENEAGQRADVGLAALLELTRSNMQKLLFLRSFLSRAICVSITPLSVLILPRTTAR